MPKTFLRYDAGAGPRWARRDVDGFHPLAGTFATTGDLLAAARQGELALEPGPVLQLDAVRTLSPITRNQQFIAQATNYRTHLQETGGDPYAPAPNVFFGKAPSSLCGAYDPVVRPKRVKLLDYEVELGLVVGRPITQPEAITTANLLDWLGAVVIVNDISARDVQIPEGQFFKGKSFRSFSPAGPYLVVLEAQDAPRLESLILSLWVNGQLRQSQGVDDMIFRPAQTLAELSSVMDLYPGDLVITGTPGGVALSAPSKAVQTIGGLLPPALRFKLFIKSQLKNPRYLQPGDLVRAAISDPTGALDLGEQRNPVEAQP